MSNLKRGGESPRRHNNSIIRELINDLRLIWGNKYLLTYFVVFILLAEAVLTIQANMPLYLENVMKFSTREKGLIIIGFLSTAIIGAVVNGRIADRIGYKKDLQSLIIGWIVMLIALTFSLNSIIFSLVFLILGFLFGALWTILRAIYTRLIPVEKRGEYFGLYAGFERLSAIVGPAIWGSALLVFSGSGIIRYTIAMILMIILMAGALLLSIRLQIPPPVDKMT